MLDTVIDTCFNRTINTTEGKEMMFIITRDNKEIISVENEESVLRWFHQNHSYSMHHATAYEGYTIKDTNGNIAFPPFINGRTTLYY